MTIRISPRQRTQARDASTVVIVWAVTLAIVLPVLAVVAGLSWRLLRWVAG